MPQRDELYLADIVEASRKIATRLQDVSVERWDSDDILRDAVVYQMQIIGEAVSSLSDEVRAAVPDVPWRSVRGFRNIVVHAYFAIDWKAVWDTARTDVPDLEPPVLELTLGTGQVGEQIDGLVELGNQAYIVEAKWWKNPLGVDGVSRHLVRVYGRAARDCAPARA